MNSFCSFCASTGIKGPHDHFLRASKTQCAAIVCPKLLTSECNWCHRKGHTAKFCGAKKDSDWLASQARKKTNATDFNSGEWMQSVTPVSQKKPATKAAAPMTNLVSMFAALDTEDPSSSDEGECIDCDDVPTGVPSWAGVVRGEATQASDEEQDLPPLIFGAGKAVVSRWADA